MDWVGLRTEIGDTGEAVAALLRDADDGTRPADGVDWTIAEVGAHLVDVARRDIEFLRTSKGLAYPEGNDTHEAMAAMNAERMATVEERDPEKLAALLIGENETLLTAAGADPDRTVTFYDFEMPVQAFAGIWLGELLIHGLDVARALDRGWPISREQATAVIDGLTAFMPVVVDRYAAPKAAGTYHLHVRGGKDYGFRVEADGELSVRHEKPERADLHVSVNPVAYLLVGYGRTSQWAAVAKGQIRAWGRKPWLALRFGSLFNAP